MNPETLKLTHGKGTPEAPCLMSKASLVHAHRNGYLNTVDTLEVFTDSPCWADPIVRPLVVFVNDGLPEGSAEFDRLDALMPRILNATKISDPVAEKRVHARVLCSEARKVLHLFEDKFPDDDRPRRAIETREAWLCGEATEGECARTADAAGAARAARAVGAAWDAWAADAADAAEAARAAGAADAAWAARSAWAADAAAGAAGAAWTENNGVDWLDEFLDTLEKAKAEEGVLVDDGWVDAVNERFAVNLTTNAV